MKFWAVVVTAIGLPALLAGMIAPVAGVYVAAAVAPAVLAGVVIFRRTARKAQIDGRSMGSSLRTRSGITAAAIIAALYMLCSLPWFGPLLWNWYDLSEQGMVMAGAMLGLAALMLCPAIWLAYLFGTGLGQQRSSIGD